MYLFMGHSCSIPIVTINEDDISTDISPGFPRLEKQQLELSKKPDIMKNITTKKFLNRKSMLDLSHCSGLMIKFKVSVVP